MAQYYANPTDAERRGFTIGEGRKHSGFGSIQKHFSENTLKYLSEGVIDHLVDSLHLMEETIRLRYTDYSFLTAPAYKAFEGFLFQIAKDLGLPSNGAAEKIGVYFDEEKVNQTIDNLIDELAASAEGQTNLTKEQAQDLKDRIVEMKRFLRMYRHSPAHFHGDSMHSKEKAQQNTHSIYQVIDNMTKVLQDAALIPLMTTSAV